MSIFHVDAFFGKSREELRPTHLSATGQGKRNQSVRRCGFRALVPRRRVEYRSGCCQSKGSRLMKKIILVALASVALASVGACAGVGKGKGKAPPPVAAPVITKG